MTVEQMQQKQQALHHPDFADHREQALLEQVIALRPLLRSEAREGERNRTMTDKVFRALCELDIWWLLLPRRWGGRGLSSAAFSRINREIARGDPSVAWVVQIINGTTWISSLTADALQRDLFGDGPVRICSSFATTGTATPVDGGYIINGEWTYNSGCRQADWGQYLVNIVHPDGSVSPGNFAYVPMKDVRIVDTWYCAGLQGTSSDSAHIADQFIPEHHMLLGTKPAGTHILDQTLFGEPSDYWPTMPLIRSAGLGLLVGAAEGALELAIETAHQRSVPNTSYKRQADSSVIQHHLGEAASKIKTAWTLAQHASTTLDRLALAREVADLAVRADTKSQASMAVKLLTEALDTLMFGAGSSAFLLDNPLQRFWRDLNVAARHAIYNPDVGFESYGRELLGVQPNIVPSAVI